MADTPSQAELSNVLNGLMSDGRFAEILSAVKKMTSSAEPGGSVGLGGPGGSGENYSSGTSGSTSGITSGGLPNNGVDGTDGTPASVPSSAGAGEGKGLPAALPDGLIDKLPEIMAMISSGKGSDGAKSGNNSASSAGKLGSRRGQFADRRQLLKALKPFLSERRRAAVDSIINIAGIADIIGL